MPESLTKRIFHKHVIDQPFPGIFALRTDLVMCHEITTPPAILENQAKYGDEVFDSRKIIAMIDHVNPSADSATALQAKIIREWAHRKHIRFYDVGDNGVCHALLPETGRVRPGMTIVCGDSHTCTHGAFGTLSFGIGTTDLQVALLKGLVFVKEPKVMRIHLTANPQKVSRCVYAKDVILYIISQIGVKGATNHVIEFTGPVVDQMGMDGRMTMCNMAVEAGATSGVCYPDQVTVRYYESLSYIPVTQPSIPWTPNMLESGNDADSDQRKDFDLSTLEPQVAINNSPGGAVPVKQVAGMKVDQVYIGSCTNGRLHDLEVAADFLRGRHVAVRTIVVPATSRVQLQAVHNGTAATLMEAGVFFSGPTCGACLGMSCGVLAEGEVCASTTNRNFPDRMGKGGTVLLMSPATAAATALRGVVTDPREVM